ncbi:MAG: hypothetical protein ACRD19_08500 [Terriglobia bacterium]
MNRPFLDLPEAVDKIIKSLRVYDDPPYGREVHIAFTDGTQISIDVSVETAVNARHYRGDKGDLEVLHQHSQKSVNGSGSPAA